MRSSSDVPVNKEVAYGSSSSRPPRVRRSSPKRTIGWVLTPDRFLRPEQVALLRDAVIIKWRTGTRKQLRDATILDVLLGSGLRVSEVCALRIGDLHLQGGAPALFVHRGKGGRARLVPISSSLAVTLNSFLDTRGEIGEVLEPSYPVFVGQHGVELTRFGVSKVWKAALQAAGLPNRWGIHSTRHSYAVEIYRRTRDLRLTQRLLGHSSPTTTMVYANLLDEDVRAGVEQIWT